MVDAACDPGPTAASFANATLLPLHYVFAAGAVPRARQWKWQWRAAAAVAAAAAAAPLRTLRPRETTFDTFFCICIFS